MNSRTASREAMEHLYNTARTDIESLVNETSINNDNKFKVNMLCSIFSEYATHLKNTSEMSFSDIQKHIYNQLVELKNNAPEYCSSNFTVPVLDAVKDTLYKVETKRKIKDKFFKISGSTIKKAFKDIDLNDAVRATESLEITTPSNTHSNAFCDHYFEECVNTLRANCALAQSFINYLV